MAFVQVAIGVLIVIAPAIESVRHGRGSVPYRVTPFGYDLYPMAVLATMAAIPVIVLAAWVINRLVQRRARAKHAKPRSGDPAGR